MIFNHSKCPSVSEVISFSTDLESRCNSPVKCQKKKIRKAYEMIEVVMDEKEYSDDEECLRMEFEDVPFDCLPNSCQEIILKQSDIRSQEQRRWMEGKNPLKRKKLRLNQKRNSMVMIMGERLKKGRKSKKKLNVIPKKKKKKGVMAGMMKLKDPKVTSIKKKKIQNYILAKAKKGSPRMINQVVENFKSSQLPRRTQKSKSSHCLMEKIARKSSKLRNGKK